MNPSSGQFERNVTYIEKGYRKNYTISMQNYSLNTETGAETISELKSDFFREIYNVPKENVGYTKYTLTDTFYKANANAEFKKWTFAAGAEFYNCLYSLPDKEIKAAYYKEAELEPPFPSLTESFSKYPKLPSVYLLVMQAVDIITFDAFMCMMNSSYLIGSFSTEFMEIHELTKRNIEIGAGVYSDNSYFENEELFVRFIGKGIYHGEECWIVEYDSAPAEIYVQHKIMNRNKKSKSLYSGKFYLSVKTGEILYGDMDENVISIGKSRKYAKRKIVMAMGEENI